MLENPDVNALLADPDVNALLEDPDVNATILEDSNVNAQLKNPNYFRTNGISPIIFFKIKILSILFYIF